MWKDAYNKIKKNQLALDCFMISFVLLCQALYSYVTEDSNEEEEEVEFSNIPSEASAIQSFAQKAAQE